MLVGILLSTVQQLPPELLPEASVEAIKTATEPVVIHDNSGHAHATLRGIVRLCFGLVAACATVFAFGAVGGGAQASARMVVWSRSHVPVQMIAGGVNLSSSVEQTFASYSPTEQRVMMRAVRSSGATWIRIAMAMPSDEYTPRNFTWYSDTEVRAALAAGLHVDGLIGWPASWARNADGSPNMSDWATFAETTAAHYSAMGVSTFEIWNEPNTDSQWQTGVNISAYAQLLRTIYPVIKSAHPKDNVMVGGLAPVGDSGNGDSYSPLSFLTALYQDGAGGSFDSVGLHPYSYPALPTIWAAWNPWTYLPQIHALMQANGDGSKQIWFTEFGAPVGGATNAVTLSVQSRSFSQAFAIARGWTWAGPIFAYSWFDWDGDGTGWFGLHASSGRARPALKAFEQAIASNLTLHSQA